jgi:hypothetical protein
MRIAVYGGGGVGGYSGAGSPRPAPTSTSFRVSVMLVEAVRQPVEDDGSHSVQADLQCQRRVPPARPGGRGGQVDKGLRQ